MPLGELQPRGAESAGLKPLIDVAGEGEGRLDALGRVRVEGLETLAIQASQIVRDAHQLAQFGDRAGTGGAGQGGGVLAQAALGGGQGGVGFGEIQPLGRRQDDQQGATPAAKRCR